MSSKGDKKSKNIENINYPYFKSWDKDKTHVLFDINNTPLSLCNSIRRSIISLVMVLRSLFDCLAFLSLFGCSLKIV